MHQHKQNPPLIEREAGANAAGSWSTNPAASSTSRRSRRDQDGGPVDNAVDAFFRSSNWTREDAMVALSVANVLLFAFVAYLELKQV